MTKSRPKYHTATPPNYLLDKMHSGGAGLSLAYMYSQRGSLLKFLTNNQPPGLEPRIFKTKLFPVCAVYHVLVPGVPCACACACAVKRGRESHVLRAVAFFLSWNKNKLADKAT